MKGVRLGWMMLVIAALLMTGCARGLSRDDLTKSVDPMQQAIADASQAADAVTAAAQKGDLKAVQVAYEQFRTAFLVILGPVSLEDPTVAQKMANANTNLEEMVSKGQVDVIAISREVSAIKGGLRNSVIVMARAKALPAGAQGNQPGAKAAPVAAKGNQPGTQAHQHSAPAAPANGPKSTPQVTEQTIDVTAVDYRFQPSEIRVKKGTKVTIRFTNKGTKPHEFEIEAYDFEIGPIQPGQTATKSFVAGKAGRFEYICQVDDHLQRGMKGFLVVE